MKRSILIVVIICFCALSIFAGDIQIGFMTTGISHSVYDNILAALESADFTYDIHEFWDFTAVTADTLDSLNVFIVPEASYPTTPDAIRLHFEPIIRPWIESGGLLIAFHKVGLCFINDVGLARIDDLSGYDDSTLYITDPTHPALSGVDSFFVGAGGNCVSSDFPDYTPLIVNRSGTRMNSGYDEIVSGCTLFLGWNYTSSSENQDSVFKNSIRYWSMVSDGPICRGVFPRSGYWVSSDTAIVMNFFDPDGIDASSASVIMDGVLYDVLDAELTISSDSVIFRPSTPWADGDTITFKLVGIEDVLGHESPDSGISTTFYIDKATPFVTYREPDSAYIFSETPTGALIRFSDAGCGMDSIGWSLNIDGVDVDPFGGGIYLEGDSTVIVDFASAGISITSGDTTIVSLSLWDAPNVGEPNISNLSWWFLVSTSIEELKLPENTSLYAYPNPFNSAVAISFAGGVGSSTGSGQVGIEIFDICGHLVTDLPVPTCGNQQVEPTPVIWRPKKSLGSGVYLVRARVGDDEVTKRIVYLK